MGYEFHEPKSQEYIARFHKRQFEEFVITFTELYEDNLKERIPKYHTGYVDDMGALKKTIEHYKNQIRIIDEFLANIES